MVRRRRGWERNSTISAIPDRRPLLADAVFLRLWLAGAFAATARWLEMLAVGIFVFEETGSPLLVAAMLMLRMLPLALFGVFGGEVASRLDRRRVLLVTLAMLTALAVALAGLAFLGRLAVWHVGVGAFVTGLAWATDFPVRRTLLADAAGSARVGAAMSLDTVASSGTRMLGPILGGALYALAGMEGAFALTAGAYGIAFAILIGVPRTVRHAARAAGTVTGRIRDAVAQLGRLPVVQGILAVTVVFNVWGFPVISMVPVLGAEKLHLAPFEIGVLASMEGLGSLLGAIGMAAFARHRRFRQLFVLGVLVYLVAATAFANSTHAILSGALLLVLGLALAAFAAMQSALVLLNTPEESRQRMMGLLSVCIGSGPIGFAHLGILASWLGADTACWIIAVEGLVALAFAAVRWPEVLARQEDPALRPAQSRSRTG